MYPLLMRRSTFLIPKMPLMRKCLVTNYITACMLISDTDTLRMTEELRTTSSSRIPMVASILEPFGQDIQSSPIGIIPRQLTSGLTSLLSGRRKWRSMVCGTTCLKFHPSVSGAVAQVT